MSRLRFYELPLLDPFSEALNDVHASSVATVMRSFTLPTLSKAGRTSREKTGLPSGSGGAL